MRVYFLSIALLIIVCRIAAGQPFKEVVVQKRAAGVVCDTCNVPFALDAEPDFSYLITGAGHTPQRFYRQLTKAKSAYKDADLGTTIHVVSGKHIGITFLPNYLTEQGKRIQLYRNFGGEDLKQLEFEVVQNGDVIKQWSPVGGLSSPRDLTIVGTSQQGDATVAAPWPGIRFSGDNDLAVNDSLAIRIRHIKTKKHVHTIKIIRAEDKATNFVYYQLSLSGDQLSANIQDVLNTRSGKSTPEFVRGDKTVVFSKDHDAIGIIRYIGLDRGDEVEYATQKSPYNWRVINTFDPGNGAYIVFGNDLQAGKDHEVYLRYKSQPETVHAITIRVRAVPFVMPWGKIAGICIFLLVATGVIFYLLHIRNKRRLATLKLKNADTETRLSLLSGQLNPHFLYNSLTAIQGNILSNDADRSNAYIGSLAAFMRKVMDIGKKEFISLLEELSLEEDYLKLEQQRATFTYTITVAPGLDASQIDMPPLLLQPVLENSLRHAFPIGHTEPEINISVSRTGNDLYIEIADNGRRSWETNDINEGHGLSLTRKRMAVYNEKLEDMPITMQTGYHANRGTVTTFTFTNWLA